jgi:glucokinase
VCRSVVLGLDFGGSKIAAAVADLDGRRIADTVLPVRPGDSAAQTFERGVTAARALLDAPAAGGELVAVGACTFGIPGDDGVDLAPTIDGWEQLPFERLLHEAFPTAAVRSGTDVKAAAQAEADHGALAGCDPGLYLNLGTGLAAALVVRGTALAGRNGAAGEIGYNLRRPELPSEAARLEDAVSGKALEVAAAALYGSPDVVRLFGDTSPAATRIVTEFVAELAFHLVNLTIAVDPQRIAVGGGLVRAWDRIGPALADALAGAVPYPPELVVAAFPYDAPLIGAIALGVAAARQSLARQTAVSEGAPI